MVIRDQINQFQTFLDLFENSPNIKDVNCILSFKCKPKVNYSLPDINDNLYLLGNRDEAIIGWGPPQILKKKKILVCIYVLILAIGFNKIILRPS